MQYFDDAAVASTLQFGTLIADLGEAFREDTGGAQRVHFTFPNGAERKLLVMPALAGEPLIGVKILTLMPKNKLLGYPTIDGLYLLLNEQSGEPVAALRARLLTSIRTAAVSALASSYLSREDASTLLMVGTGALARHLIEAHCLIRPISRVMVWGRDPGRAQAIIESLGGRTYTVERSDDLARAVGEADIISAATSSTRPLVYGEDVRAGTHLDLVGSFAPAMREVDLALITRGRVVVDNRRALEESGDLIEAVASGWINADEVPTLGDLIRDPTRGALNGQDFTVFSSVGTAIADLVAAKRVWAQFSAGNGVVGMASLD